MRAIPQEMLKISIILGMILKITYVRLQLHIPGAYELILLIYPTYNVCMLQNDIKW